MELKDREVNFKKDFSLFIIGDIHEGAANFAEMKFKQALKIVKDIKKERPIKIIFLGDMIDAITYLGDKRFNPAEIAAKYRLKDLKDLPRKQMKEFVSYLGDLKNDVDIVLIGNHEEAYIKHNGFDVYDYLCSDLLGNVDLKLGYKGVVRYSLKLQGKHARIFRIALSHGAYGGGFREGYPINLVFDMFKDLDMDMYIIGHLHKMAYKIINQYTIPQKGELRLLPKKKLYMVNGCFLEKYKEGQRAYGENMKGQAPDIGFYEIKFFRRYNKLEDKKYFDRIDYQVIEHRL